MLTADEMFNTIDILSGLLQTVPGDPRDWLNAAVPDIEFTRNLKELLTPASNYRQSAVAAVQVCLEKAWGSDPPWLTLMLEEIHKSAARPRNLSNLAAIYQRLAAKIDPRLEACEAELVLNDVPFLDRIEVRAGIRELLDRTSKAVMVVCGPSKSGRSYCTELFQFVSGQQGYFFRVATVAILPGQGSRYTPALLAQNIALAMGVNDVLHAIDPAAIDLYKSFIFTAADKSGGRWWIVLDGFNDLPPENETRALIQALSASIANERYREKFRLILVDYSGIKLNKLRYIEKQVTREAIDETHTLSYLTRLNNKYGNPCNALTLQTLVHNMWAALPQDETRLATLNEQISGLAYDIVQGQCPTLASGGV
jgi:hypothetical protein